MFVGVTELVGLARLRQVLETADWEGDGGDVDGDGDEDGLEDVFGDDGELGEGDLQTEMQRVLGLGERGMKEPILSSSADLDEKGEQRDEEDEEDEGVEDLQHMFLKLQAARDLGTSLPTSARRKLAARTVAEIMSKP